MADPPKYPRIARIATADRIGDDIALGDTAAADLLTRPVIVEEKLDGANITVWVDAGVAKVATRGGAGATDRAGILGPIRAWAAGHGHHLHDGLDDRYAVYGEWLHRRHAVPYSSLPGPYVGFDVLDRSTGDWLAVAERDEILAAGALPAPPRLFAGTLGSTAALLGLHGRSRFGPEPAEGLVVKATDGPRLVAKWIAPRWAGVGDAPWSPDPRSNLVAAGASPENAGSRR